MLTEQSRLDKNVPIPLYYQLKTLILEDIKNGTYKTGDSIPTEKELSEMFSISRTTIRQAITELVQEGWLYRVKSKGTFVSAPRVSQEFLKKIQSFNDEMINQGMTPSTEVLELKVLNGSDVNFDILETLGLKETDRVIFLYRKRMADEHPIVLVKTFLSYDACSEVLSHDLSRERLYSILFKKEETKIFRIERTVKATEANAEDARLLDMKRGKAVQIFESIGYNSSGDPVEYSLSRYRGDSSKFSVTVFPEEVY